MLIPLILGWVLVCAIVKGLEQAGLVPYEVAKRAPSAFREAGEAARNPKPNAEPPERGTLAYALRRRHEDKRDYPFWLLVAAFRASMKGAEEAGAALARGYKQGKDKANRRWNPKFKQVVPTGDSPPDPPPANDGPPPPPPPPPPPGSGDHGTPYGEPYNDNPEPDATCEVISDRHRGAPPPPPPVDDDIVDAEIVIPTIPGPKFPALDPVIPGETMPDNVPAPSGGGGVIKRFFSNLRRSPSQEVATSQDVATQEEAPAAPAAPAAKEEAPAAPAAPAVAPAVRAPGAAGEVAPAPAPPGAAGSAATALAPASGAKGGTEPTPAPASAPAPAPGAARGDGPVSGFGGGSSGGGLIAGEGHSGLKAGANSIEKLIRDIEPPLRQAAELLTNAKKQVALQLDSLALQGYSGTVATNFMPILDYLEAATGGGSSMTANLSGALTQAGIAKRHHAGTGDTVAAVIHAAGRGNVARTTRHYKF